MMMYKGFWEKMEKPLNRFGVSDFGRFMKVWYLQKSGVLVCINQPNAVILPAISPLYSYNWNCQSSMDGELRTMMRWPLLLHFVAFTSKSARIFVFCGNYQPQFGNGSLVSCGGWLRLWIARRKLAGKSKFCTCEQKNAHIVHIGPVFFRLSFPQISSLFFRRGGAGYIVSNLQLELYMT